MMANLHLSLLLKMLTNGNSLLDEVVQVLRQSGGQTYLEGIIVKIQSPLYLLVTLRITPFPLRILRILFPVMCRT